jgi:PiT family inorganic phosphate transporter
VSAVRWGIAGNIAAAWVMTLPAAALVGAIVYEAVHVFGNGAVGPVVISAVLLIALAVAMARRVATGRTLTAEA